MTDICRSARLRDVVSLYSLVLGPALMTAVGHTALASNVNVRAIRLAKIGAICGEGLLGEHRSCFQ